MLASSLGSKSLPCSWEEEQQIPQVKANLCCKQNLCQLRSEKHERLFIVLASRGAFFVTVNSVMQSGTSSANHYRRVSFLLLLTQ